MIKTKKTLGLTLWPSNTIYRKYLVQTIVFLPNEEVVILDPLLLLTGENALDVFLPAGGAICPPPATAATGDECPHGIWPWHLHVNLILQ